MKEKIVINQDWLVKDIFRNLKSCAKIWKAKMSL